MFNVHEFNHIHLAGREEYLCSFPHPPSFPTILPKLDFTSPALGKEDFLKHAKKKTRH
jgi:hypothetical protein